METSFQKQADLLKNAICKTHAEFLCDCHGQTEKNAEELQRFFKQLYSATQSADAAVAQAVLADERIKIIETTLRRHTSQAEYALELYWARKVAQSDDPENTLRSFPLFANYRNMLRANYHALCMSSDTVPEKMLFIGSGPLPHSALLLTQLHGVTVECVDYNAEACAVSRDFFGAFGLREDIKVHEMNILDMHGIERFDAIILAALVGETAQEKQTIIRHLSGQMRPGALLLARAGLQLKTLCYPAMDAEQMPGLTVRAHIHHPANQGINSIFVGEKPSDDGDRATDQASHSDQQAAC